MFQNMYATMLAWFGIAGDVANDFYETILRLTAMVVGVVVAMILVMWVFNISGVPGFNLLFFFAGVVPILFLGFLPRVQVIGSLTAMLLKKADGASIPESVREAIPGWYTFLRTTVIWFWVVAGLLSAWSFEPAPGQFFFFAAAAMFLATLAAQEKWDGKKVTILLAACAILVMGKVFWTTRPEDWKSEPRTPSGVTTKRVVARDFTIPANGSAVLQVKLRCYVDNISDEQMQELVRTRVGNELVFASTHDEAVTARVWFFDERGQCMDDYVKLNAERVFL